MRFISFVWDISFSNALIVDVSLTNSLFTNSIVKSMIVVFSNATSIKFSNMFANVVVIILSSFFSLKSYIIKIKFIEFFSISFMNFETTTMTIRTFLFQCLILNNVWCKYYFRASLSFVDKFWERRVKLSNLMFCTFDQ